MYDISNRGAIYLAKPAFLAEIKEELRSNVISLTETLFYSEACKEVCFAQDSWFEPQLMQFESITTAAKKLREINKYWYLHPINCVRRSRLIEQQLRNVPSLEREFPIQEPIPLLGVFGLLDQHTLVYSTKRMKTWPDGQCGLIEDKKNPPNRAYLKLWEAFSVLNQYPKPGETALDLGASPGGWSFVLQVLGAQVTAIDKAPLADKIAQLPRIQFIQQSAFAFEPQLSPFVYDWVCSDVACYPVLA